MKSELKPNNHEDARVLWIDDRPMHLFDYARMLQHKLNITIDFASTIQEAERKCRDNRYKIIITDIDLPGDNAIDFLTKIRKGKFEKKYKSGNMRNIPIVVFTGYTRRELERNGLENLGEINFVSKFDNLERLEQVIARFIIHR